MERIYWTYSGGDLGIVYRPAGLFVKAKEMHSIYFYEENDLFYEFFSGEYIGTRGKYNGYTYIVSDDMGALIPLTLTYYSVDPNAYQISAAKFAELIRPYLNDRALIAMARKRDFAQRSQAYQREKEKQLEMQRLIEDTVRQESQKERQEEKWLDDLINEMH